MREAFKADIAYVALLDEELGVIEFPYYVEDGAHAAQEPLPLGEGLTSQIIQRRRAAPAQPRRRLGGARATRPAAPGPGRTWACRSWPATKAIGAISVQSTTQEGRFGERTMRLLSTIAANVGVAIQNARLYGETQRRARRWRRSPRSAARSRRRSSCSVVLERIVERAKTLLERDTSAVFLRSPTASQRFAPPSPSATSRTSVAPTPVVRGEGIIGDLAVTGQAEVDQRHRPRTARRSRSRARRADEDERLMVAPLIARGRGQRHDGRLAHREPGRRSPPPT